LDEEKDELELARHQVNPVKITLISPNQQENKETASNQNEYH